MTDAPQTRSAELPTNPVGLRKPAHVWIDDFRASPTPAAHVSEVVPNSHATELRIPVSAPADGFPVGGNSGRSFIVIDGDAEALFLFACLLGLSSDVHRIQGEEGTLQPFFVIGVVGWPQQQRVVVPCQ